MSIIGNPIVAGASATKINSANIAPAYSATTPYAVGDIVTYKGKLYRCTTAIPGGEAWNASHWQEITVKERLKNLQDAASIIKDGSKKYSMEYEAIGDTPLLNMTEWTPETGNKTEMVSEAQPSFKQIERINDRLRDMRWSLAAIAEDASGISIESYEDLKNLNRLGIASSVLSVGDQISVNKTSAVTAAKGAGSAITGASVVFQSFLNKIGTVPAGIYEFVYNAGSWHYLNNPVTLADYGITATGTPADGDIINVTVTGQAWKFDILGIDFDKPSNSEFTHSISLGMHDVFANCQFDASEALFYVNPTAWASGLPAGTYYVKLDHGTYGNSTTEDGFYSFTTTAVVPAGGVIRHTVIGTYSSSGYSTTRVANGKFACYNADRSSISALSSLTTTYSAEEPSTGVCLGTFTARDPQYVVVGAYTGAVKEDLNFTERNGHGSNRYLHSAIKQWLNSNAASGWWVKQNNFDMPCTSITAGFLYGLDPDFVNVLGTVKKRTAKAISEGYSYEDTDEVVFLQSRTEVYGDSENGVREGSVDAQGNVTTTAYPYWIGATNADRIKYLNNSARNWWLRSPYSGYASNARIVNTDGSLDSTTARNNPLGAVPGLCIV